MWYGNGEQQDSHEQQTRSAQEKPDFLYEVHYEVVSSQFSVLSIQYSVDSKWIFDFSLTLSH